MESSDSGVWTRGEPITLRKICQFLRKGSQLDLNPGNIVIPLEDASKRVAKSTDVGKVYVWSFLLSDGSITEFYLHTHTYKHSKNIERDIEEDLQQFFGSDERNF